MSDSYPGYQVPSRIPELFDRIQKAGTPSRFTYDLLKTWGFTSSNDRAIVSMLKQLGFLNEDGVPSDYYDRLRDRAERARVLAERLQELYKDVFAVDQDACSLPDDKMQDIFNRVTGKEAVYTRRYTMVFKALCDLADFSSRGRKVSTRPPQSEHPEEPEPELPSAALTSAPAISAAERPAFVYRVEIHLPATTDLKVYNAIFRSIKEHLG